MGWTSMTIFSCSACGGHAFRLSADLKQAHCEDCNRFLGGWTELKAKIKQNLRTPQLRVQAPTERRAVALY